MSKSHRGFSSIFRYIRLRYWSLKGGPVCICRPMTPFGVEALRVLVDGDGHQLIVDELHQHRPARDDVIPVPAVHVQHAAQQRRIADVADDLVVRAGDDARDLAAARQHGVSFAGAAAALVVDVAGVEAAEVDVGLIALQHPLADSTAAPGCGTGCRCWCRSAGTRASARSRAPSRRARSGSCSASCRFSGVVSPTISPFSTRQKLVSPSQPVRVLPSKIETKPSVSSGCVAGNTPPALPGGGGCWPAIETGSATTSGRSARSAVACD